MASEPILNVGTASIRAAVQRPERRSGLALLTVRLLFRPIDPAVQFTLTVPTPPADGSTCYGRSGAERTVSWELPFAAFQGLDRGAELAWPAGLSEHIEARIDLLGGLAPMQPLWLKLARPYGMLGVLPWEASLGAVLGCPVLRLPGFTAPPAKRPDMAESAVLVDPGPVPEADAEAEDNAADVVRRVRSLMSAILRGSARAGTVVHLFTTADWYPVLAALHWSRRVRVHDPREAQTSAEVLREDHETPWRGLRSTPWSNWIAAKAHGVDAVHLLCRAQRTDTGAELVLSSSPSPAERRVCLTVIDQNEILLLLTRAGAWSISLVPVSCAHSPAVAFAADGVAQHSAGAVLFHGLADQRSARSLAAACKLLYGDTSSELPRLVDGFLYCHPAQARRQRSTQQRGSFPILAQNAALLTRGAVSAPLGQSAAAMAAGVAAMSPNWVGSTQRFLESAVFDDVRKRSSDILLSAVPAPGCLDRPPAAATDSRSSAMLQEIQDVIASYLKSHT